MTPGVDLEVDGLEPADIRSEQAASVLWSGDLRALAQHHALDGSRSFLLAHDGSVTWGVPGAPQIASIAITRDFDRRTFVLQSEYHGALPFAQAWLIERGCPAEQIALLDGVYIEPADDLTRRIEQKILDAEGRYTVLDTPAALAAIKAAFALGLGSSGTASLLPAPKALPAVPEKEPEPEGAPPGGAA